MGKQASFIYRLLNIKEWWCIKHLKGGGKSSWKVTHVSDCPKDCMDSFNPRGSAAHDRSPLTLFYFESLTVIVGSHANCSSYSEVTLKEYFVVEEIVCFSVKKKELVTFGMFLPHPGACTAAPPSKLCSTLLRSHLCVACCFEVWF